MTFTRARYLPVALPLVARFPFAIVDVFTDTALAGNQLAVFTESEDIPGERLQPLALEMGFSETVFVYAPQAPATARIRIFTPRSEIPFAGHPVLGTAVAFAIAKGLDSVVLTTGRGDVPLTIAERTDRTGFATMQQPIPTIAALESPERLLEALGLRRSILPIDVYDNGLKHAYAIAEDIEQVIALRPDFGALENLSRDIGEPSMGINCAAGSGEAWTTRMFAPASGINEDPATGSAAGPLACHLARHRLIEFGQTITISQGAQNGRPSTLFATAYGERDAITQVEVAGSAVIVASGAFDI